MKSKVAIVIKHFSRIGGGENFAVQTSMRLAAHPELEVHVLANSGQFDCPGIQFHQIRRFPLRPLRQWMFASRVCAAINRIQPDIIHTHERIFEADTYSMHATSHRYWKREVTRQKTPRFSDLLHHKLEKRMLNNPRCRVLMPVSSLLMETYDPAEFQLREKRVVIIPPGVENTRMTKEERARLGAEFRSMMGYHEDERIVLFAGMNFEHKGLPLIIQALAAADIPNSRLVVAGNGNIRKFTALARRMHVGNQVDFFGVRSDMPRLYAGCDVLALPSRFETFGMVAIEAAAAGTPVIISNTVGARDLLQGSAHIIDGSAEALVKALKALFGGDSQPAVPPRLANWDSTTAAIAKVYRELH